MLALTGGIKEAGERALEEEGRTSSILLLFLEDGD